MCFVCTGNICRSPMAEVVGRTLAGQVTLRNGRTLGDHLEITSAGTGPWHVGEEMDPRTRTALFAQGFVDPGHRARQFARAWFDQLDLIVALDRRHRETLRSLAGPNGQDDRIVLLRSFDPGSGNEVDVPDPYYGDATDFDRCLALVRAGCQGLVGALGVALDDAFDQAGSTRP